MHIFAYGGANIIPKELTNQVTNCICNTDPVPQFSNRERVQLAIEMHGKKGPERAEHIRALAEKAFLNFQNYQGANVSEQQHAANRELYVKNKIEHLTALDKQNLEDNVEIIFADDITHSIIGTVYTDHIEEICKKILIGKK